MMLSSIKVLVLDFDFGGSTVGKPARSIRKASLPLLLLKIQHLCSIQNAGPGPDGRPHLRTDEDTTEPIKQSEKLRFTCPYLKFDPKTYEERNCRSKAWLGKDIHRLNFRDHLYKEHRQKPHCHRCGEMFNEESQVTDHLMRPICCNLKPGFKVEGFSRKQEADIRDRKMKRGDTPEAKWTAIFGILFPGVEVPDPSPPDNESLDTSSSVKIENVFTGAIPSELEKTTRSKLEAISGPLNENQWREMLDVFKDFTAKGLRNLESRTSRQALKVHFDTDAKPTSGCMGENDTVLDVPDIVEAPGMDKAAEGQVNSGDWTMPLGFGCGPISTTASENTQPMSFSNRDGIYDSDPQLAENGSSQDYDWGWMGVSDGCGDIFSSIPVSDVPIETNLDSQEGSVVFLYDPAFEGLEFLYNDWATESAEQASA
ncbi:hypothetical protein CKAH01_04576 [Colletotrichum kahawae]|uniref:C2H2-type domain-containing protein n=1 Tax=Colletotrichum kahawae TaxID=34407 RepID=A0AAD9YLB6_COLKA|nr:hypothetical protein CKAH01_04576 [Colletotrichum kahawae]